MSAGKELLKGIWKENALAAVAAVHGKLCGISDQLTVQLRRIKRHAVKHLCLRHGRVVKCGKDSPETIGNFPQTRLGNRLFRNRSRQPHNRRRDGAHQTKEHAQIQHIG